eukprot:m.62741 g.62741  ORF g.62741 m.62741 type:complete len:343 (-) comp9625_c1_seq1:276-1304(-)
MAGSFLEGPVRRWEALSSLVFVLLCVFRFQSRSDGTDYVTKSTVNQVPSSRNAQRGPPTQRAFVMKRKTTRLTAKSEKECLPADNPFGLEVVDYKDIATGKPLFKMAVFQKGDIVSNFIKSQGWWELSNMSYLIPMHSTPYNPRIGDVFLDVGANVGTYSAVFAHLGFKVISVEPMTANRAALEVTTCLNPHFDITVIAAAVGTADDARQQCVIRSRKQNNKGNGVLSCGPKVQPCRPDEPLCEKLESTTLDTVLSRLDITAVDVVKMDVESFECRAFMGGQSLLTKYHPKRIQVEHGWNGVTEKCLPQFMKERGYTREHYIEENEGRAGGDKNWVYGSKSL